jgi:hypothetical protein
LGAVTLRNKQWLQLPDRPCDQQSNRLAACASRSSVRQPRGCHRCWNETLLALHFDASASGHRLRSVSIESIGYCLNRFQSQHEYAVAPGCWTHPCASCPRISCSIGYCRKQACLIGYCRMPRGPPVGRMELLGPACIRPGTLQNLNPCRQAAYFLPCTRPPDSCGSCLDRPCHRRPQGSLDRRSPKYMVKGEIRAAVQGLRRSTEKRNARAEKLGSDGGPQTRKQVPGGAVGLAGTEKSTQNLFRVSLPHGFGIPGNTMGLATGTSSRLRAGHDACRAPGSAGRWGRAGRKLADARGRCDLLRGR